MRQETLSQYQSNGQSGPVDGEQCPICAEVFKSRHGVAAHAWQKHDARPYHTTIECDYCGDEIRRADNKIYGTNFCDSDCQYSYQTGERHQNANRDTRPCDHCGTDVTRPVAAFRDRVFCDRGGCYASWLSENVSGEDSPHWKSEKVQCCECGEDIWRAPYQLDGRRPFCSYECIGSYFTEYTHRRLTDAVRSSLSDLSWVMVARGYRERNDTSCELCGDEKSDRGINNAIHHIIPVETGGTNDDEMLMPLCRSCHRKVEVYTKNIPEVEPLFSATF